MNVCTQDLIDGTSLNPYVAQKHTYRYAKFNQLWCSVMQWDLFVE
jgi:hypothetical protein